MQVEVVEVECSFPSYCLGPSLLRLLVRGLYQYCPHLNLWPHGRWLWRGGGTTGATHMSSRSQVDKRMNLGWKWINLVLSLYSSLIFRQYLRVFGVGHRLFLFLKSELQVQVSPKAVGFSNSLAVESGPIIRLMNCSRRDKCGHRSRVSVTARPEPAKAKE